MINGKMNQHNLEKRKKPHIPRSKTVRKIWID